MVKKLISLVSLLFLFLMPVSLKGQDTTRTISVYLDCRRACDESFVRNEITFLDYVRNVEDADVHILITNERTGSGGEEFTLQFIGGKSFENLDKKLTYYSAESDTEDEIRTELNNYIKAGLYSYLKTRPIARDLVINYEPADKNLSSTQSQNEKWNYWVFDISADTDLEGEESEEEFSIRGRASVERITPEWKFSLDAFQYFERQSFTDDGSTEVFTRESRSAYLLLVKSLNEHWSAGVFSRADHSSRRNYDLLLEGSPAIEYSLFPYEEFSERAITVMYGITGGYYNYNEVTVYGKTSEYLLKQELNTDVEFTQPWGELEARVNASAYLHDFTKNRLETELELNFRIYRGLSFYISGEYAWIHNQLSIPAGGISDAEQLLNLREQSTSYYYEARFGLEFSFGSIYNNVVNPRF